jgi:hypothetical protein
VLGGLADLLGQLALRGGQGALPLLVELAGGDLERPLADGLARLAHEPHVLVVVGDDPHGAHVADDLALDLLAVGVAEALDAHLADDAVVGDLAADLLERLAAHAPATIAASTEPAASPAAKKSSSSSSPRPIVRAGRPETP